MKRPRFTAAVILVAILFFGLLLAFRRGEVYFVRESEVVGAAKKVSNSIVSTKQKTNASQARDDGPNVVISFFGRVVDQDGNPLDQVKVQIRVRSWPYLRRKLFGEAKFTDYVTFTDTNGDFMFRDLYGDGVSIQSLLKQGYNASSKAYRSIGFGKLGSHGPDARHPVVFEMLKDGAALAEQLIPFNFRTRISCDGTPTVLDLTSSVQRGPDGEGQIRIVFERKPVQIPLGSKDYDWKARVEFLSGGGLHVVNEDLKSLWEQDLTMLYKAPENGYVGSYDIVMERSSSNWKATKVLTFYFRDQSNRYGRAVLQFDSWSDRAKTPLTVKGVINPTGSRNLQGR